MSKYYKRSNKYNVAPKNERTWHGLFHGETRTIVFDSKAEMEYFLTYRYLELSGAIKELQLQVPFKITTKRKYYADFTFIPTKNDKINGFIAEKLHIVDVKGMVTELFKLKWELMQMYYKDYIYLIVKK